MTRHLLFLFAGLAFAGIGYPGRIGYPDRIAPDSQREINGHEYVELGDGLKWATCNVGASRPEESGDYYSWGEVSVKNDYRWETYKWMAEGKREWNSIVKYTIKDGMTEGAWYRRSSTDSTDFEFVGDELSILSREDDAASVNWGGSWRTPTAQEWSRLIKNSKYRWRWTVVNGVPGFKITSRVRGYVGNSIFLPAAGGFDGSRPSAKEVGGYYWSSSLSYENSDGAYDLGFIKNPKTREKIVDLGPDFRFYGLTVRAVSE